MPDRMWQEAPWPTALADLVDAVQYRPGWRCRLIADAGRDFEPDDHERQRPIGRGLTLEIVTLTVDSYHPENDQYRVAHWFIVPAATYNAQSWRRWLFDRFVDVERHEAAEFFRLGDERPYAPHHGPGHDPYTVFEHGDAADVRVSYRGTVNA